jgi:hypothetical protein
MQPRQGEGNRLFSWNISLVETEGPVAAVPDLSDYRPHLMRRSAGFVKGDRKYIYPDSGATLKPAKHLAPLAGRDNCTRGGFWGLNLK